MHHLLFLCFILTIVATHTCPNVPNVVIQGKLPGYYGQLFPMGSRISIGFNFSLTASIGNGQDYIFYDLLFLFNIQCHASPESFPGRINMLPQHYHDVTMHQIVPGNVSLQGGPLIIDAPCPKGVFSLDTPILFGLLASNTSNMAATVSVHIVLFDALTGTTFSAVSPFVRIRRPSYPLSCVTI